jgi:hypothetical protein
VLKQGQRFAYLTSVLRNNTSKKYPTLVPTSSDSTTTAARIMTKSMAVHQTSSPSLENLVFPITGGSSFKLINKKQKKETQRRVQHVGVLGPYIKSKWSHIPLPFLKTIFISRIIHIGMLWLCLVSFTTNFKGKCMMQCI